MKIIKKHYKKILICIAAGYVISILVSQQKMLNSYNSEIKNYETQIAKEEETKESLMEIKSVCKCGKKATVNARFIDGKIVTDGEEVLLGKEECYKALCYNCYVSLKKESVNDKDD